MREMAGRIENTHWEAIGESLCMGDRDDAVIAAPDHLNRHRQLRDPTGQIERLPAARKPYLGNFRQGRGDTVEPFVAQNVLDHCATDEGWVVDQETDYLDRLAAARYADEPVDEGGIDLGSKPGRGDQ